jgi:hypothetical protein
MTPKQARALLLAFSLYGITDLYADTIANPCGGPSALLALVDRPTVGDSACVIPFKQALVEMGYQYQQVIHPTGYQHNLPAATLRVGLPASNEIVLLLPNYNHQSVAPRSGVGATTLGVKHEIGYTEKWLGAVESLITLPSGSSAFGSQAAGIAVNGIVNYTFNSSWGLSCMLGVSTQTEPNANGGQRYTSVNPDLVLTYVFNPKVNFYGEFYGQSKTGPGQNSGYNMDAGVLYLILPTLVVDLEAGQRLTGQLDGFNHYIGAGLSIEI